jgi:hypothetical protein
MEGAAKEAAPFSDVRPVHLAQAPPFRPWNLRPVKANAWRDSILKEKPFL